MKTQTLERTAKPFTLNFVEPVAPALYDEAIKGSEILKQSYDPKTQTSNIPIYAGTSLTYSNTGSNWVQARDDSKESDT
ncbi:hypothetical protein [Anabaena sp. PCC 7108]|uniref:hypothetical protein n=1 Tax=Anabaena sp. PCC 7108 TaxID=163908 RepID=UPI00034DA64D|nr:hypothetical protein [Anabaena sp. PCC 7108]